jgi:hypothetical protein
MSTLRVKNWSKYQHYKDRCPPWIKLATDTFQNYEFSRLQDASKLLAICIWTIASRSKDGSVPHDFEFIKGIGRLGSTVRQEHLKELINQGFVEVCSEVLADCKQSACSETEGETEERRDLVLAPLGEPVVSDFDRFWEAYPRRTKKANARKAWKAKKPEINAVLSALSWQRKSYDWTKEGGQFVPHPASYLNAEQWTDEPTGGKKQAVVARDPNCAGWHASGKNTGRKNPRGHQLGCPECKSVELREWTAEDRPSEPTPIGEIS